MDLIFFFFLVLPSSQDVGFLVLILPCYSFYPCFLLPIRVPFLGVFFFSLSCIVFLCSLRFCWLLPACPHPSHPVFGHIWAWAHTCTHCTYICVHPCAPRQCSSLTPVSCSWRYPHNGLSCYCCHPCQQPVSRRGHSGGKETRRKVGLASGLRLRMHPRKEAGF